MVGPPNEEGGGDAWEGLFMRLSLCQASSDMEPSQQWKQRGRVCQKSSSSSSNYHRRHHHHHGCGAVAGAGIHYEFMRHAADEKNI